jgi:hypothetical protein
VTDAVADAGAASAGGGASRAPTRATHVAIDRARHIGDLVGTLVADRIDRPGRILGTAIAVPDGRVDGVGYCLLRVSLSR